MWVNIKENGFVKKKEDSWNLINSFNLVRKAKNKINGIRYITKFILSFTPIILIHRTAINGYDKMIYLTPKEGTIITALINVI